MALCLGVGPTFARKMPRQPLAAAAPPDLGCVSDQHLGAGLFQEFGPEVLWPPASMPASTSPVGRESKPRGASA